MPDASAASRMCSSGRTSMSRVAPSRRISVTRNTFVTLPQPLRARSACTARRPTPTISICAQRVHDDRRPRMDIRKKPHATGKVKAGDTSQRVGIEQLEARGVNVAALREKLIDAAGAEFTTYYYYTILRM